jgi:hypothetical protein
LASAVQHIPASANGKTSRRQQPTPDSGDFGEALRAGIDEA